MLGTVIVGLGRAGADLHLPVLRRIRQAAGNSAPLVGVDRAAPVVPSLTRTDTVAETAALTDPDATVVHLCTPPANRAALVAEWADGGFRRFVVEKPLATDAADLAALRSLVRRRRLDLIVMGQWLCSSLTRRLRDMVEGGEFGPLRSVLVYQRKPRIARSLAAADHPTAFDVEIPHALGVVLALAGGGRMTGAGCTDLTLPGATVPRLGSAWLTVEHGGVSCRVESVLHAPVRERRIELRFDSCQVVGHYPCSSADEYAHLEIDTAGEPHRLVFRDDSLAEFMARAYAHFDGRRTWQDNFALHVEVVRLLLEAKDRCGAAARQVAGMG